MNNNLTLNKSGYYNLNILLTGVKITKARFLSNLVLQFAFNSLYYLLSLSLPVHFFGQSNELFLFSGTFHLILTCTVLVCMLIPQKINGVRSIYLSSIALLVPLIIVPFFPVTPFVMLPVFIAGVFFAICQLLSFTYFWSSTVPEERGRVAGVIGFVSIPLASAIRIFVEPADLFGILLIIAFLILVVLSTKLLNKDWKMSSEDNKETSVYCFEKRTVILYALPWILFAIVNTTFDRSISIFINQSVPNSLGFSLSISQVIGVAAGALGGGIVADLFGRKLSLSFSLTVYGLSTVLSGFVQSIEVVYFMYLVNGLNWGILWSLYGTVIWGDLSDKGNVTKRYASALTIFYSSLALGLLFVPQITQLPLVWSALLGCSLIFLSNVPLFLAPELLSESFRDKVRLKLHMRAVKRLDKASHSHG